VVFKTNSRYRQHKPTFVPRECMEVYNIRKPKGLRLRYNLLLPALVQTLISVLCFLTAD
jgi:hypothetical protein